MPLDPIGVDLARRIYDYGLTAEDLGPRLHGRAAVDRARGGLDLPWPAGLTPTPRELAVEPDPGDPMPRADVLVITWTAAELLALADVLTPGVNPRTRWYRYDRSFDSYRAEIRKGAPAQVAGRLGSYYPTKIGSKSVLCVKSELHLNQDGVKTGAGTATLPVARFLKQIYAEVKPKLVITVGTAGGTLPNAELGDVMITRSAKFKCTKEFRLEDFNGVTFTSTAVIRKKHLVTATALMQVHASELTEPAFGPPTKFYDFPDPLVPGHVNTPNMLIEGRDFAAGLPMLTTDFFEFGTSANGLEQEGCGVEMGDAVFGLVGAELGDAGPKWLVIRNASDPQINGDLPTGPPSALDMQAHWAVWYYEAFGYWTSVNSAIATWAMIAP
jgi:nucleoside phosphorylase